MLLCRQAERRDDIKEVLQHWGYSRAIDMSPFETEGQYFEVGGCPGSTVLRCAAGCTAAVQRLRGCTIGFTPSCLSLRQPTHGQLFQHQPATGCMRGN